jgi:hypothetical protein
VAWVSWFVLINAVAAVLAAIPVALGAAPFAKMHRPTLGLLIGVPPSLYMMGSTLVEYGLPKYTAAWVVEGLQILSISVAVLLVLVVFTNRPLTFVRADAP